MISARLVGLGSLYFPKVYGPLQSFQGATEGMLEKLNKDVPKDLEKALFLSPNQVEAMNFFNFIP